MHKEILSKKQTEVFPKLNAFSNNFGLVGGTAIALHLGHRQSIDFDLASPRPIHSPGIRKKLLEISKIETVMNDTADEYTLIVDGIKFTFFNYPFDIVYSDNIDNIIKTPDLLSLAAMKAYALGRRAKWKDYVDLYFIAKKTESLNPIIKKSKEIFKKEFNEKTFRSELAYFDDIDYSEQVAFLPGFETDNKEIKKTLSDYSL